MCIQGLVDTVLFHVDALTGEDSTEASTSNDVLKGLDIIAGPLVETFFVREDSAKFVLLFDEFLQVRLIWPTEPRI